MKFNTVSGDVEIIHPRDLLKILPVDNVHQTVQQYHTTLPLPPATWSPSPITTATYNRQVKMIEPFVDVEDFILDSLVRDIYGNVVESSGSTFDDAMNDAACECLNQFGSPTHAVIFNPNVIIMGDFTEPDSIVFKQMGPNHGALIIYKPKHFAAIHSKEKCPYIMVEPKYGRYVSNVLIMDTIRRLGLV